MKVLFIILPILALIGFTIWVFYSFTNLIDTKEREIEKEVINNWSGKPEIQKVKEKYEVKNKSKLVQLIMGIALLLNTLLVLIFVPASIHQVEAGQVAVVKIWGDAKEIKTSGMYLDFWVSRKYEYYDIKVQQTTIETQAYSSDGQTMDIELVVQYQIQPQNAILIANNYGGLNMLESRIETISTEKMKSVLSQKSAMVIIETRSTVSPLVESSIRSSITNDFYVNITTVVLTDISFTKAFEKTVEDKMIAEQEQLKAQYEKEKAIIQAEQALEVSKLNAQSKLAEAEGNANAIREMAKAEADAIKLKSIETARMMGFEIIETPTDDGIEYTIDFTGKTDEEIKVIAEYIKYIEYLSVWNGELPSVLTNDNASILIPTP